jgi:SOS-response transcriptional repressor LexA
MDIEWIIKGLDKPGKTKAGLAKAISRHPAVVTNILSGKRELKAREISIISRYLEVDPPENAPIEDKKQIATAFIIGDVAAGVWSEPGVNYEPIPSTVVVDARWPEHSVFVLRVRGSSINRQAKEGDLVLCLDAYAAPRDFQNGDWVVAERVDAAGRIETTVKRVVGNRHTGFVLSPDSDDPAFQTPIKLGKHDGESVAVKAFVLEFIKPATTF